MTSTAQKCLESDDEYGTAVAHHVFTGKPSPFVKRFHFADGTYLDFEITYTVTNAGRYVPDEH